MRGITLIETLICLALFSSVITAAVASLVSIESSAERIEAGARLTDEGHFILEKLRYGIERADSIRTAEHSFLSVVSGESLRSFYLEGEALIQETDGRAVTVSEPGIRATGLSFSMRPNRGVLASITLETWTKSGNPLTATFFEIAFPLSLP